MTVVVITPPAEIIDLDTAKAHLRVDHADDDALIEAFVGAATSWLDGPSGWLGRSLGLQTLEARFDRFDCDFLALPYGPIVDIVSVRYDDADGVEQTVASVDYTLQPGGVRAAYAAAWPSPRSYAGAVRVRYRAGYAINPDAVPVVENVPAAIKAAILLMVGNLYANREAVSVGNAVVELPFGVEALLSPFRVWSL